MKTIHTTAFKRGSGLERSCEHHGEFITRFFVGITYGIPDHCIKKVDRCEYCKELMND